MKISNKIVSKFQEGGAMPPAEDPAMAGAPAPADPNAAAAAEGGAPAGGNPIEELAAIAQQALEAQDCQAALTVCEVFLGLLQGQGQGAPAGPEAAGQPVYRKGGKLVKRVR